MNACTWMVQNSGLLRDDDLRRRLGAGACRFAGTFSWDRCADETMALIETTLGEAS